VTRGVLLLLATCSNACAKAEAPAPPLRWEPRMEREEGTACIGAPAVRATPGAPPPVLLNANAPVQLFVTSDHCLSSSCSRNVVVRCDVQLNGTELSVAMTRRWEQETSAPCTLDCLMTTAACQTPPLAAGSYVLLHGGARLPFTLPGKAPSTCLAASKGDR
jgi:hypothetical protein